MLTVHVRVNDAATGKPTPVRIRILDGTGTYHPPLGRLAGFATGPGEDVGGQVRVGGQTWAYIDGTCEVQLPPGEITVEVQKGPEYGQLRRQLMLAPGQISLRLAIERWADWRQHGWYAGDVRAHELTPRAALLEGAAEGLAVVQLLARERPATADHPAALCGLLDFSGTTPAVQSDECLVAVNTLNHHPLLGTVALLHAHRPVFPLRFGAPGGNDGWSVADWCDQCHRKKGLVVWPDLPRLSDEHPQGETLAALVLGKVDAFEVSSFADPEPTNLGLYYRLLDCGLRPALVGGSGKESNAVVLGAVRTYAQLEEESLTADAWAGAVRKGQTFVTNGPLLRLDVSGQGPGRTLRVEPGQIVRLRTEAQSTLPFDHLELLAGGNIVAAKPASGNRQSAILETDLVAEESTWIAARCHGGDRLPTGDCIYAHTTPVWLEVSGKPQRPAPEAVAELLAVLARTRRWVETEADCPAERQRQHLLEVLDEAGQMLRTRGED